MKTHFAQTHHKNGRSLPVFFIACLCLAGLFALAGAANAAQDNGLKVLSLIPRGEVQRLTKLVVRFDRPMVPLGTARVSQAKAPLAISPPLAGEYRWLDPSTLAFILDTPQVGAMRLKLSVPAGVKALDGSSLAQAVSAVVNTRPIKAVRFMPEPGRPLGPKPQVRAIINQPLDLDSLARRAWWEAGGKRLPVLVKEAAPPSWRRELPRLARLYTFTLAGQLPPGQRVRLVLEPGIRPAKGNLALAEPIQANYSSFKPLRLNKWEMPKAFRGGRDPASGLTLNFNNPVSPREVLKYLKITPALKLEAGEMPTYSVTWVSLPFRFKPRAAYQVSILPGLKDNYGTTLAKKASFSFKTGDYQPVLELPGGNGVLETTGKAVLPLKLRNLDSVRIAARWMSPDQAVKGFREEDERSWRQKPQAPKAGQANSGALTINFGLAPNQSAVEPIVFKDILGRSPKGGLVLLDVRSSWPDHRGKMRENVRRSLVQVTDLGLSLKLGPQGGLAWVTRLSSGKPQAGAKLELRDRANRVMWQGQSGPDGLAKLPSLAELKPQKDKKRPWLNPVVFLMARFGEDWAVLPGSWGDSLRYSVPYTVDYRGPNQAPRARAHALFQLPLYQPGQTVRYLAYVQTWGKNGLSPAAKAPLELWVEDPMGRKVHQVKAAASRFGSVQGAFQLTPGARLGSYGLRLSLGGQTIYAGSFRVASFRPPEFRVELKAPANLIQEQPTPGRAKLEADYLFGAPVAKGQARLKASQRQAHFAPELLEGYAVGDLPLPGKEPGLDKDLGLEKAVLNQKGQGAFKLPQAQARPGLPVRLVLEAQVEDASGLAVRAGRSVWVHPSELYLGLKAPLLLTAGQPARIELAAASYDNRKASPQAVTVVAYRQWWESVRERGPGGFFHHLSRARRKEVWRGQADLAGGKGEVKFSPPQSGSFVLVAEAKDLKGRLTRSATYVWASGQGVSGWQRFDDHRLELVAGRKEARPGDTLKLMIKNPFAQATALVTVERSGVSRTQVVPVQGPAPVVEVPILAQDAPGVYVGVLLVRGRAKPFKPGSPDLGRPQVRIGYAPLKVSAAGPGPQVRISTQAKKFKPGQEVRAALKVTDQGRPVRAEVALIAVDERILAAAKGANSYDPRRTFDRMPGLGVMSADLRTMVLGRFALKGKGEGPGGGGGKGPAMRRKFHPAVFWLAQAITDDQGGLKASFKLPDSLTAYRIVAVAGLPNGSFGLGQSKITASLPLQMLPALPRFAVKGDSFQARVLVQNLAGQASEVQVGLTAAKGLEPIGSKQASLKLAPGESRSVSFPVKATRTGQAFVEFAAQTAGHQDAARFSLEVIPSTGLTTFAAAGVLPAGAPSLELPFKLPEGVSLKRGGLGLSLAPSPAAQLARPAETLLSYPWNCLEQRLSRAAARALRLQKGSLLGLKPGRGDRARLEGLGDIILDYQAGDGSFSFWPGASRGDLFLTAYAALALSRLAPAGVIWSEGSKRAALNYLERTLKKGKPPKPSDLWGRLAEALAVYALGQAGRNTRAYLAAALTRSRGLPPFGLACLMLAAGRLGDQPAIDGLLRQLEGTAEVTAEHLHFAAINPAGLKVVMGSTLRGNALALEALTSYRPTYPRLDALARWVAAKLAGQGSISTQEAVFGLWGLCAYLQKTSGQTDLTVQANLGQEELLRTHFSQAASPPKELKLSLRRLGQAMERSLGLSALGRGSLFWSTRLQLAQAKPPKQAVNAGFTVSRFFRGLDETKRGQWKLGSEMECLLTVITQNSRSHVLVEVPYPAGLEPVDALAGTSGGYYGPWRYSELRKTKLMLYAPELRPGVYSYRFKLRAVAQGGFLVKPARAGEMYAPEVFGHSGAGRLEIK